MHALLLLSLCCVLKMLASRWCVCVGLLTAMLQVVGGLKLNTGITCKVPIEIPPNTYMCFWSKIEPEVVDYQLVEEEVQVLTRPCATCFPEVKTVTVTHERPVFGDVCTLRQLWRNPRNIRKTTTDVRILTTPGLLMNRNYPSGLLCVWGVECKQDQKIYFNASTHSTQGLDHNEVEELCPDYIQVVLGNTTLESCGLVPHEMLVNQVQGNSLDVIFRSDQHTTAQGLRLDTTCFQPLVDSDGATGEVGSARDDCTVIGGLPPSSDATPNDAEQELLQKMFQLHFDLFSATDACSRGVQRCAETDFRHLATAIEQILETIKPYKDACNPIVQRLVIRTLELLEH